MVAVCRGNLSLVVYNVSGNSASKKEERDLQTEIKRDEPGFSYKKNDRITNIRFLEGNSAVRIVLKQGSQYSHIDVSLAEQTTSVAPAENFGFSDLSVFAAAKNDPSLQDQCHRLEEKLTEDLKSDESLGLEAAGVSMPSENNRYVGFLNRILKDEHFFQIYDIQLGHCVRRFTHEHKHNSAFCLSADAQWMCRVEDKDLEFKVAHLPQDESVSATLRMQYKSSTQDNYGNACDKKQTFRDRIYRDLHVYHMYEEV